MSLLASLFHWTVFIFQSFEWSSFFFSLTDLNSTKPLNEQCSICNLQPWLTTDGHFCFSFVFRPKKRGTRKTKRNVFKPEAACIRLEFDCTDIFFVNLRKTAQSWISRDSEFFALVNMLVTNLASSIISMWGTYARVDRVRCHKPPSDPEGLRSLQHNHNGNEGN